MDFGVLIGTILSSAGVFSLIQFFVARHDRKNGDMALIKKELGSIKKAQDDTNLRVTRIEITNLLHNDPDNIDAILQVAETYFIEQDGNAYVHSMFEQWAKDHGVAIGWLPTLMKGGKDGRQSKK